MAKVSGVTHDNASNITCGKNARAACCQCRAAARAACDAKGIFPNAKSLPCADHSVHLAVGDAIGATPEIEEILQSCRAIVSFFNFFGKDTNGLAEAAQACGIELQAGSRCQHPLVKFSADCLSLLFRGSQHDTCKSIQYMAQPLLHQRAALLQRFVAT